MKYMPSRHFASAVGLLALSFFIMQKAVIPNIDVNEMSAQAASFNGLQVISKAQAKLSQLGLYDGKINSRLTLETKIALTKFQKENNLKQTGLLDAPTQKALLGIDLYPEKNPNLVSGKLRKLEWEEFDEKNKKITTKEPIWYLEQGSGKSIPVDKRFTKEDLVDQRVSYDYKTKEITRSSDEPAGNVKSDLETQSSQVKTVVFLAQFANSTPVPYTVSQYRDLIFGPSTQATLQSATHSTSKSGFKGYITRFFKEMTHNQVNITGNVYGWYSFPENGSFYYDPGYFHECYLSVANIQEMANFYQVDLSTYDRIVTVSNCQEYGTLGGAAFNSYPNYAYNTFGVPLVRVVGHQDRLETTGTNGYLNYPGLVWNLIHELGHTFGPNWLGHSNTLDCGLRTIWIDCTNIEYGDPFDAMGSWGGRIFNFHQQEKAGWIGEDNILEIHESASYHLDNLQTPEGQVAAKIYVEGISDPLFGVEHRKATGFDSVLSSEISQGLILYTMKTPQAGGGARWRLADPHPTELGMSEDTIQDSIRVGHPFHDENFGVTITVTSVTSTGIDFSVVYDYENSICGSQSNNTTFNVVQGPNTTQGDVTLLVSGNSAATSPLCPSGQNSHQVSITESSFDGWIPSVLPTHLSNINNGTATSIRLVGTAGFAPDEYNLNVRITDVDNSDYQDYPLSINVLPPVCEMTIDEILHVVVPGGAYNDNLDPIVLGPNYFNLSFVNNYTGQIGCPTKNYSIAPINFPTYFAIPNQSDFSVSPGGGGSNIYTVTKNPATPGGVYELIVRITDLATLETRDYTIPISIPVIACETTINEILSLSLPPGLAYSDTMPPFVMSGNYTSLLSLAFSKNYVGNNNCPTKNYSITLINPPTYFTLDPNNGSEHNFNVIPSVIGANYYYLLKNPIAPPGIYEITVRITDTDTLETRDYNIPILVPVIACETTINDILTLSVSGTIFSEDLTPVVMGSASFYFYLFFSENYAGNNNCPIKNYSVSLVNSPTYFTLGAPGGDYNFSATSNVYGSNTFYINKSSLTPVGQYEVMVRITDTDTLQTRNYIIPINVI